MRFVAPLSIWVVLAQCAACLAFDCDGDGEDDAGTLARQLFPFAAATEFEAGFRPTTLSAGDLDGDGRDDLVVSETSDGSVSIWLASDEAGEIQFALSGRYCVGVDPRGLALADFDGDGRLDIACGFESRTAKEEKLPRVTILYGDGTGAMESRCLGPCEETPTVCRRESVLAASRAADGVRTLTAIDMDGDTLPDLVCGVRNAESSFVTWIRNRGARRFDEPVELLDGGANNEQWREGNYASAIDIDGDRRPEVFTAGGQWLAGPIARSSSALVDVVEVPEEQRGLAVSKTTTIDWFMIYTSRIPSGSGGGQLFHFRFDEGERRWRFFREVELLELCDLTEAIVSDDFNLDGHVDLVLGNSAVVGNVCSEPSLIVFEGGVEGLSPVLTLPLSARARWVTRGDFDGDGLLDLAALVNEPDRGLVSVFRNTARFSDQDRDRNGIPDRCQFHRGDVNRDASVDIADAIFVLAFLFLGAEHPACLEAADIDNDTLVGVADAVRLLSFLFRGGPPPEQPRLDPDHACEWQPWDDSNGLLFCLPTCSL